MDMIDSLCPDRRESAVWQFFENYDPPAEEFCRLVERFHQLSEDEVSSYQQMQQIDEQICRILNRLNGEAGS
jgi:hypothetical protein